MKIERRDLAMKMFWIALAILAIALSLWGATRSAAAETEEFPVWWPMKIEVESLDKIDAKQKSGPNGGRARFGQRISGLKEFGLREWA